MSLANSLLIRYTMKLMPLLETLPEEHGFSAIFILCSAIPLHCKTEKLNDTFTSSKMRNKMCKQNRCPQTDLQYPYQLHGKTLAREINIRDCLETHRNFFFSAKTTRELGRAI